MPADDVLIDSNGDVVLDENGDVVLSGTDEGCTKCCYTCCKVGNCCFSSRATVAVQYEITSFGGGTSFGDDFDEEAYRFRRRTDLPRSEDCPFIPSPALPQARFDDVVSSPGDYFQVTREVIGGGSEQWAVVYATASSPPSSGSVYSFAFTSADGTTVTPDCCNGVSKTNCAGIFYHYVDGVLVAQRQVTFDFLISVANNKCCLSGEQGCIASKDDAGCTGGCGGECPVDDTDQTSLTINLSYPPAESGNDCFDATDVVTADPVGNGTFFGGIGADPETQNVTITCSPDGLKWLMSLAFSAMCVGVIIDLEAPRNPGDVQPPDGTIFIQVSENHDCCVSFGGMSAVIG